MWAGQGGSRTSAVSDLLFAMFNTMQVPPPEYHQKVQPPTSSICISIPSPLLVLDGTLQPAERLTPVTSLLSSRRPSLPSCASLPFRVAKHLQSTTHTLYDVATYVRATGIPVAVRHGELHKWLQGSQATGDARSSVRSPRYEGAGSLGGNSLVCTGQHRGSLQWTIK